MTTTSAAAAVLTAGLTVPALSRAIDFPLDRLRILIKRRPELREQFVIVGPVKVLPHDRLESFRQALSTASATSSCGRSRASNATSPAATPSA